MQKIKIFGERNSGTNYLEQLLEKNLEVDSIKYLPNRLIGNLLRVNRLMYLYFKINKKKCLGWKHGKPKINEINQFKEKINVITITKNPYSFLLSLYKKPYHYMGDKNINFSQFIRSNWRIMPIDNCKQIEIKSPIDLWNVKNKSYIDLNKKVNPKVINIKYESLIMNPKKVIQEISEKGDIKLKSQFTNINNLKNPKFSDYSYYRDYYLNERWLKEITNDDINYISKNLDKNLMELYYYDLLN